MVPVVNHVPRFSYDGMGNVKVDNLLNNYTYDAEGRPITAAGVQTTFDAFGRALELNHNATYTQMVLHALGMEAHGHERAVAGQVAGSDGGGHGGGAQRGQYRILPACRLAGIVAACGYG